MMLKKFFPLIFAALFLQACTSLTLGGAATTASITHDRRGAAVAVDDNAIVLKIRKILAANSYLRDNSHVNVTGYNGTILLTGEAFDDTIRQQIAQIATEQTGVKRVENQIVVGRRSTLGERAFDTGQTAKVKTALFNVALPNFDSSKIKVVTEHGYTYLLGIVSPQEAKIAIDVTRQVSDVKGVISLFEIQP